MIWHLVAIDPSLNNMGVAIFIMEDEKPLHFVHAGLFKSPTYKEVVWQCRAVDMTLLLLRKIAYEYTGAASTGTYIVTELQENFFAGKGTASKDNEAIQKLYFLTGAICSSFIVHPRSKVKSIWGVRPTKWKGQIPKNVGIHRANAWCAKNGWGQYTNHNITDALLIAKFAIEHVSINQEGPTAVLKFIEPVEFIVGRDIYE